MRMTLRREKISAIHLAAADFEKRENLRRNLDQQPADDGIGDCDLVNIAPLQFGEEAPRIQSLGSSRRPLTFFTSAWKRGSARNESSIGSTFIRPIS